MSTQKAIDARRKLVAKYFPSMSGQDLAKKIGVGITTICNDAKALGLKKSAAYKASVMSSAMLSETTIWHAPLREVAELMYPVMGNVALGDLLGLSQHAIGAYAYKHGLKKDKATRVALQMQANEQRALTALKTAARRRRAAPERRMQGSDSERPNVQLKGPPPMSQAQIAQREKERFSYPPDALPWRAQAMQGPAWVPPPLSYRGQIQRSTECTNL